MSAIQGLNSVINCDNVDVLGYEHGSKILDGQGRLIWNGREKVCRLGRLTPEQVKSEKIGAELLRSAGTFPIQIDISSYLDRIFQGNQVLLVRKSAELLELRNRSVEEEALQGGALTHYTKCMEVFKQYYDCLLQIGSLMKPKRAEISYGDWLGAGMVDLVPKVEGKGLERRAVQVHRGLLSLPHAGGKMGLGAGLSAGMAEARLGEIEVEGDEKTVQILAKYLYQGEAEELEEQAAHNLFHLAERHGMKPLLPYCYPGAFMFTVKNHSPQTVAALEESLKGPAPLMQKIEKCKQAKERLFTLVDALEIYQKVAQESTRGEGGTAASIDVSHVASSASKSEDFIE
jgi:hypothetical protein